MVTVKAVLNRDRERKTGDYALVIQIIHRRVKRVFYTPYKLKEPEFDRVTQKAVYTDGIRYTRKQVKEINSFILQKKTEIEKIITWSATRNQNFSVADIVTKYHLDQSHRDLVTFMESHIAKKEEQGKTGTARAFHATLRSLKKYIDGRMIEFADIDHYFVKGYEAFLTDRKVKQNTICFYIRNFRTIYNHAEESGIDVGKGIAFRKIKIKITKTVKRALKKDVIERIARLDLSGQPQLEKARDLFMFSFYTRGMSFIDIIYLQHTDIMDGVIYYRRQKTNQYLEVAVTEPLQRLINKYATDNSYVLPFINEYNGKTRYKQYQAAYGACYKGLNRLQKILDISTPLTTYVARHSWATIAKEQGTSISIISEGLGHSSENTTQIYLKGFDRSVIDRVNEKIVSFSTSQNSIQQENRVSLQREMIR